MQNEALNKNSNDIITFQLINPNVSNITNDANTQIISCYDYHSGKTIQITKDSIKIYNKKATKLLISLKLMLPIEKIKMISLERNIEYALVYLETKTMNKSILVLNLRKGMVISILQDDYRKFLGMFFLSIGNRYDNNQQFLFCIIFEDRITVKMIIKETENIVDVKSVKYGNSIRIDEYIYNKTFKVLCCIRSDNSFDFYHLESEFYFSKAFNWNTIKRRNKHWSHERLEGMQLYLQVIYHKLYWIVFDVEQKLILLFRMKDINNFSSPIELRVSNSIKSGTLAFSDQLIIVFDYLTWEMMVIDITSHYDNKIISTFTYSNPCGFSIEQLVFKGGSVVLYQSDLYNLTFNLSAYYNSFPYRLKQEALLSFLKRKNSKQLIYDSLNEMIKRKFKIMGIFAVLNAIVDEIWKGTYEKIDINKQIKPTELIIPVEYHLKRRNMKMKLFDAYCLFKSLERNSYIDKDILRFILIFNLLLKSYGIKLSSDFIQMMLTLIKSISIDSIINIFELTPLFDNEDVAVYLLQLSSDKTKSELKPILRQIAFDIFKRLKRNENGFMFLLSEGKFKEAFSYYSKNSIKLSIEQLKVIVTPTLVKHNKKLMLQYITQ